MEVAQDVDPAGSQRAPHADVAAPLRNPVQGQPDDAESGDRQQQRVQHTQHDDGGTIAALRLTADFRKRPDIRDDSLVRKLEEFQRGGVQRGTQLAGLGAHQVHDAVIHILKRYEDRILAPEIAPTGRVRGTLHGLDDPDDPAGAAVLEIQHLPERTPSWKQILRYTLRDHDRCRKSDLTAADL